MNKFKYELNRTLAQLELSFIDWLEFQEIHQIKYTSKKTADNIYLDKAGYELLHAYAMNKKA